MFIHYTEDMKLGYYPAKDIYIVCDSYEDGLIRGYKVVRNPKGQAWTGLGMGITPSRMKSLGALVPTLSSGDVYGELIFDSHLPKPEEIKHVNLIMNTNHHSHKKIHIRIDNDIKISFSLDVARTLSIEVDDVQVY